MTQIVLIRPGVTEYDRSGRIQGTLDIPLTQQGREQTAAIADALREHPLEAIYTAPCRASVETATLIASALAVKLKQLDKMRNLDCGLWQGMQIDEVRRRQPKAFKQWQEHPELLSPPEGETPAEAEQRIAASLEKLCKKHKQGTVALVVPEPLAGIVRAHLLDTELAEFWADSSTCGTWEILSVPDLAGVT